MTNRLSALAALAALTAGCASAEQGYRSAVQGQSAEQGAIDMANCRNLARLVAGANRYAWYSVQRRLQRLHVGQGLRAQRRAD
jgi:hypothetical protein